MLTCKQTSLLMSQARDRRLSWSERLGVRLHLWICRQCRRYERQLDWLNGLAGRLEKGPESRPEAGEDMSAEACQRIREAIEAHREDGGHRHPQ
ncbi:MAG: zf-HC2 domain-containing protein [Thiobacillaceae bacterium]|jgi:hypothetical protein|nr:zf-HC2 domain-containing protein [Thiobacillaceae bacterium]